jgi:hypothetical protein
MVVLVLVNRPNLPASIVTARWADDVGQLPLVALRAFADGHGLQRVVRAAF